MTDQQVMRAAANMKPLEAALVSLHYAYPATVFLYYITSTAISVCTLQTSSEKTPHPRRKLMSYLMLFAVLSYLAQCTAVVVPIVVSKRWLGQQDAIISLLSCILVFGLQLAGLQDTEKPVWHSYIGSYWLALIFEPTLESLSFVLRRPAVFNYFNLIEITTVALRYASIVLILVTYFFWRNENKQELGLDSEHQPLIQKRTLLANGTSSSEDTQASSYGSTSDNSTDASQSPTTDAPESPWQRREREARDQMEKRLKENGNWFTYAKSFVVFLPYIWPVNNKALQIRAVLVGVCLLLNNGLNVLIPRQLGIVTDSLNNLNSSNPWFEVLIFAALKLCASEAGLSLIRQWLWVPVEFYSFDAMSTAAYSHVLNLSSDFHDSKSSSDIMMAIQSGQSVSNLLESICFSAIPMIIDMGIAFIYLSITFGPYEGLITIATSIIFLYIAMRMISGLKSARRSEVSAYYEEHYVRQAGIQGWSTVTSFNQIGHEEQRYSSVVKDRVSKSQTVYFGYLVAYAFQYLVLLAGLLAGAFLAVWQVTGGTATPGQFIMLLTYWAQLVSPLNFFAGLGKNISRNLIHAEQLLEIMKTKPTVVNKEDAEELKLVGGAVEFDHVYFSYDCKKQILKDIDFSVAPGTTVAFVGPTGAGKSTILKLLDRFYDVTKGSIKIDGQDIRDVDLFSLRTQIGIVPQAPILFDDTIMNNVRYAKLCATDDEVHEACRAACIHEQILGFSDGYQTRVGERGIKLSGGELQRVAIARAILKSPSIVLLDEATSAVDTETEQRIQEALHALCHNRTTFVVAHRLSTVMNADHIIVVAGGEIVERGSHEDLIRTDGKYAELWSKQVFMKPKHKDGKSDSTPKEKRSKLVTLVNDLSPEATSTELAKVKSAQTPLNLMDDDGTDASKQDVDAKTPSGHKKEGSKLNPDAPTFTPRTLCAVLAASPAHLILGSLDAAMRDLGDSEPAKDTVQESAKTTVSTQRRSPSPPPVTKTMTSTASANSVDHQVHAKNNSALAEPSTSQMSNKKMTGSSGRSRSGKVKFKRPRYNRRVQSKSEPSAGSTQDA